MVKKGKYKLFSYLVENHLIYYKSLKKNNKIIAFAILQYINFKSIESLLNEFLINRIIHYYSIQIDTNEKNKNILLLNFEEYKKESIIKAFNIVKQNLGVVHSPARFLKEQVLEKLFLAFFFQNINFNTSITKISDSIIISAEQNSKFLNFYSIDLDAIKKKTSFVSTFLNLITSLGKKGFLIFNFTMDSSENIKISPYFVLECENIEKSFTTETLINNFFHCNLVKKQNVEIRNIFNFLWRLGIIDTFFFLNEYYELFSADKLTYSLDLLEINKLFERNLLKNQIEYMRLSKNLLFIEQTFVFLILESLNCDYVHRIIEKYYPKYIIYILILNDAGYKELQEIESAKLIENIRIINLKEIQKFNYKELKIKSN